MEKRSDKRAWIKIEPKADHDDAKEEEKEVKYEEEDADLVKTVEPKRN